LPVAKRGPPAAARSMRNWRLTSLQPVDCPKNKIARRRPGDLE
jgi:hypothetical protein